MAALDVKLGRLATLAPAALREEWGRVMKTDAPTAFPPDLLHRALAFRLQEKLQGGLKPDTARALRLVAKGQTSPAPPPLKAGTRLLRSWHGRSIAVTVTEDGFVFEERLYTSLSSIAREVTGTAWSGPRFFGLVARG